ncbi:putative reverse transcriptase domain-containing protein [Tanacetum coccineum]
MEDPGLFTLPYRLGNSKPFDTLADLGSLADGTKSYPVGIVKDVEVHIGKLKLLNDFYLIDMKKDPETPLLIGRGFLATANAVIDCRKEEPQTPPVPQDEDEREPMFIQPHDPDYVLEPIYPEYIPLEDEHEFLVEEQPLPPVDSPTAESPGGDNGDDNDGDSSRDDANDKDKDEEDEEEEEEHLALADSVVVVPTVELVSPHEGIEPVIPPPSTDITTTGARITVRLQASISLPPEAEVERLLAMPTPPPSPPISLSPPSAVERLARCTSPSAHSSPPPVPSPLLPSSGCPTQIQTLRIASTQALVDAITAALPSPPLPPLPPSLYIPPPVDYYRFVSTVDAEAIRQGIREVGYGIRDTWVDPVEAVPKIAPMTLGEVNTRVTELAELHEHDIQDLYALLEDAQKGRTRIS